MSKNEIIENGIKLDNKYNYIICPECKENARILINNYKFCIYGCKNGHNKNDILINHDQTEDKNRESREGFQHFAAFYISRKCEDQGGRTHYQAPHQLDLEGSLIDADIIPDRHKGYRGCHGIRQGDKRQYDQHKDTWLYHRSKRKRLYDLQCYGFRPVFDHIVI